MPLTINVFGSTKIDETTGLQDDDVALNTVPSNVSTAFSNAGVNLANAIQVAGGGGNDLTVTPDTGFTVNGLGFVDPSGGALDGDASGLFTLEGRQIFLYADPNNDNVVLGREGTLAGVADPSGAIVLAVYVEETTTNSLITGGKFWTALFEPLKHTDNNDPDFTVNLDNKLKVAATQSNTFLFDNAPSGANEFMMFGNNPGGVSTAGIVVTGRAPDPNTEDNVHTGDTVTSSQAGPHATIGVNGQHLGAGDGLSFTMVTNPVGDFTVSPNAGNNPGQGLSATEANHEGNIQFGGYAPGVTSASFTVAQINPTGSLVTVKISAFNDSDGVAETGTGFVEGFADDVAVNITGVKINGVVVAADLSGDTAVISGVKNGDVITYTTTSAHTRVLIENAQPTKGSGSNITLDIGGFTILSSQGASEFAGTQLQFDDDGPSITASATGAPTLTVDETVLANNDTKPFTAQFTKNFGADGPAGTDSVTYALSTPGGASGLTDTATGESVVLSLVGGQILGKTATTGLTVFVVSVDASGNVTLDQQRAIVHANPNDPDESRGLTGSNLVVLTATATDGDADHASVPLDLTPLLVFKDDGPSITVNDSPLGTYSAGAQGTWTEDPGADGFKSLNLALNSFEIDTHGTVTATPSNSSLTRTDNFHYSGSITADFTNDGVANDQTVQFTLTFDPNAGPPPSYDFELTTPPGSITTISTANGTLGAGGPDPVQTLTIGNQKIVFSAVNATAPVGDIEANLDKTEAQIQTNPLPSYINPAAMNVSTSGIGVGNNNFDGNALAGVDGQTTQGGAFDESFVVDPTAFLVSSMKVFVDNSVGGYDPSTEGLFYRTYTRNADNSVTEGSITKVASTDLHSEAGGQKSFVIPSADQKNDLDAVQLFMGSGTVKIPVIEFNISTTFNPEPLNVNFTATIADGDNDTKSDPFSIHVANA
jgi:hypothetical protein